MTWAQQDLVVQFDGPAVFPMPQVVCVQTGFRQVRAVRSSQSKSEVQQVKPLLLPANAESSATVHRPGNLTSTCVVLSEETCDHAAAVGF